MKVLIVAPLHDHPTVISNIAVDRLEEWIRRENQARIKQGRYPIEYNILRGMSASRLSLLMNKNIDAFFYYGHGLKDRLGDTFMYVVPILSKSNLKWFKDKIIYTMACDSAIELGKEAIKRGVKTYYGQSKKFFAFLPSVKHRFLEDWYRLVNMIPISLMSGLSTSQSLDKYEELARDLQSRYLSIDGNHNISLLFSNALYMEMYGDKFARLPF